MKGVKVPDVVWLFETRWAQIPDDAEASPVTPELRVEVRSESNTDAELVEKRALGSRSRHTKGPCRFPRREADTAQMRTDLPGFRRYFPAPASTASSRSSSCSFIRWLSSYISWRPA